MPSAQQTTCNTDALSVSCVCAVPCVRFRAVFDVVITFEGRVMEAVEEALNTRAVQEMCPCLVVNLEVKDSHEEASIAAPQALRLAQMVRRQCMHFKAICKHTHTLRYTHVIHACTLDSVHTHVVRSPVSGHLCMFCVCVCVWMCVCVCVWTCACRVCSWRPKPKRPVATGRRHWNAF